MIPQEYEKCVAEYFKNQGYIVKLTSFTDDYGVDVFAENHNEKVAIQAKMYGSTVRKINRKMVMELHGAKDYFDCDKAILVTNGDILHDANEVAQKLKIEVLYLDFSEKSIIVSENSNQSYKSNSNFDFDAIWEKYIIPLEGRTITRDTGKTNRILKVDWSGITRITSNGRQGTIDIEIFRQTVNHLLQYGSITRKKINEDYEKRASSGIVLILSQVPFFNLEKRPELTLVYNKI